MGGFYLDLEGAVTVCARPLLPGADLPPLAKREELAPAGLGHGVDGRARGTASTTARWTTVRWVRRVVTAVAKVRASDDDGLAPVERDHVDPETLERPGERDEAVGGGEGGVCGALADGLAGLEHALPGRAGGPVVGPMALMLEWSL